MAGFGSTPGLIVAAGVGAAASVALEPAFEIPRQEAWKRNANRVLNPDLLARLVAQGGIDLADAHDEANRQGYSDDKLDRLVYMAQQVPGAEGLMTLWRYGIIKESTWREGMVKLGFRPDFISYMAGTFSSPLTPEQAAQALQRGLIPNEGQLPVTFDTAGSTVTPLGTTDVSAYQAGRAWGASKAQMDVLARLVGLPPAPGELIRLLNRGGINMADYHLGYSEGNSRNEWADTYLALRYDPISPAEIAKAIHRGIMKSDGLLVTSPPETPGKVPIVPQSTIDPVDEAMWSGITAERLRVLVGNAGLPPGIVQMLSLLNRGIIEPQDFQRGVGESNLRNEWGPAIEELRWRVLTGVQASELWLRGWITQQEAHALGQLDGYKPETIDYLHELRGRPITTRQITTGLRKGGTFNGPTDQIPEAYLRSLQQGSIRPEWYELDYLNATDVPPSFFVTRALLQANAITPERGQELFSWLGWPEDVTKAAATTYAGGTVAVDPNVKKADTQLWNLTHRSYVAEEIDDAYAQGSMDIIGIPATAQTEVLKRWARERDTIRKQLTPTQLRKAYKDGVVNPTTGAPWTQDEVIQRLLNLGYTLNDATTFTQTL